MNDQAVTNAIYIMPKISGALSIVGSVLIVAHVVRRYIRRNKCGRGQRTATHARLLLGLSLCDLCSSMAFFVWSWAVPPNTGYGKWQYGTWGTCQAQGFFLQLCTGTIVYNSTLALYYFLSIYKAIPDSKIARTYEPYLHAFPLLVAVGTAIASVALGIINPMGFNCWMAAVPYGCKESWENGGTTTCEAGDNAQLYKLAFFTIPCVGSMAFVTVIMILIYCRIRQIEKAASRFRVSATAKSDSRRFAFQALLYVAAFYATWFFSMLVIILTAADATVGKNLADLFNILGVTLMPLQGFWNAIIYFRPRCSGNTRQELVSDETQSGPIIGKEGTRVPRVLMQGVFKGEDPSKEFTADFERGDKLRPPAYSAEQLSNGPQVERAEAQTRNSTRRN